MPNNNNAGMHFVHFASDKTALHEYDYDNQVARRTNKKNDVTKMQTSMWTADGKPIDLKDSIKQYRKEKAEFAKKQAEKKKAQQLIKSPKPNGIVKTTKTVKEIKSVKNKANHNKEVNKIKNAKKVQNNTACISPNALGNDPRFKELFASLKE